MTYTIQTITEYVDVYTVDATSEEEAIKKIGDEDAERTDRNLNRLIPLMVTEYGSD